MAIKAPEPQSNFNSDDYVDHPEGRKLTGTIYCFKNLGEKPRREAAPRDKYMIRIESDDHFMEPYEDKDGNEVIRPFTAALFLWASFGDHKTRSGNMFPALQQLRETVLDETLDEKRWYEFDPLNELIGVRVKYNVTYVKTEGYDKPKVEVTITERLDDQELPEGVELYNPFICIEEKDGKNLAEGFSRSESLSKGGSESKKPSKKPVKKVAKKASDSDIEGKRKYFTTLVQELGKAEAIDADTVSEWVDWVKDASEADMKSEFNQFDELASECGVEQQESWGVFPGDDIPF